MNRSSIALGNLRAVVIIIVLAFHSILPYLASLPAAAYHFDSAPYQWQAFRVAKPCAQGKLDVPVGSPAADWCTVCPGRHFTVAARILSDLSRDGRRP